MTEEKWVRVAIATGTPYDEDIKKLVDRCHGLCGLKLAVDALKKIHDGSEGEVEDHVATADADGGKLPYEIAMATGQPLRDVVLHPGEMAVWDRFFDRRPAGDPIVRILVARVGVMLETFMSSGDEKSRPMTPADWDRYYRWHFWEKRPDDLPSEEQTEQDDIKAAWGAAYETVMVTGDAN